jgi:RNA polymerase sigma-32 factor
MRDPQNRSDFTSYLARIEVYPELEREQEIDLARRHRSGEREAGELLLCAHLRDVVAIARGYLGYGQPLAELIAAGNLGLVRALDRFDPARGLRFMTYAGYWVRNEILAHVLSTWSVVGVGKSSLAVRLFFGLRRERARLEARGCGGAALVDALAARFECSSARILAMQQRLEMRDLAFDLDEHLAGAPADTLEKADHPERDLAEREWRQVVRERLDAALTELDAREREIVERRLLAEERPSLVELGSELGLSRERVRQLEHQACRKLRRRLGPELRGTMMSA